MAEERLLNGRREDDARNGKLRLRLEVALLAIVFGGGAGWGAFTARFNAFDNRLTAIETRLQEIYCATVPAGNRAGCR